MIIPQPYFENTDVVGLARDMIGKYIFTRIDDVVTGGMIVETEAYKGPDDRASHAFGNRRTTRNELMYKGGGVIYMYICYGIHDMLNIVTGLEGSSHAILIRAIQPTDGLETMRVRRGILNDDKRLCRGPGALGRALGLNLSHNGSSLQGPLIWMENREIYFDTSSVGSGPRIGMNFEGEYRDIPWRFYLKSNPFVSRNNR